MGGRGVGGEVREGGSVGFSSFVKLKKKHTNYSVFYFRKKFFLYPLRGKKQEKRSILYYSQD
jgi:hypothetical protein